MPKYKVAVFDMDGTILNTLDDMTVACNYTLERMGMPGRTIDEIKHDGDIPYYEYNFRSELNYRYYTAHFESEDAFWGVQFFCAKNRYDKNFAVFSEWAHAITFAD